jgi:hypothetical protein
MESKQRNNYRCQPMNTRKDQPHASKTDNDSALLYEIQRGASQQRLPSSFVSDGLGEIAGEFLRTPGRHLKASRNLDHTLMGMPSFGSPTKIAPRKFENWKREAFASMRVLLGLDDAGHRESEA